jgi:putative ABC transport system permease protein
MAVKNVGRNLRRSAITGAAILFGVAAVLVLYGFSKGTQVVMTNDVVQGRTGALQVHRKGYVENIESSPLQLSMPAGDEVMARIRAVPGVTGVTGRIQFQGLVSNGSAQTMFVGRGVDVATEKLACPNTEAVVMEGGRALRTGDENAALLGYELSQSFHIAPGQSVTVQSSSPEGRSNAIDVKVLGNTTSTFPFENKRVLTVPLATAQALLGLEGRVTEYAVGIARLEQLEQVATGVRAALGPEYEVHTWSELQPFVRDVIARQTLVLGSIGFVLFVIVLTGIINTMLMSVFERVREIGTMLAVGVRRAQVMGLFILEAGVIGLFGGVLGASLGRLILFVFYQRGIPIQLAGSSGKAMLRPEVSLQFTLTAVAVAVVGALVASAWPAWRASRLNPVDALRNA